MAGESPLSTIEAGRFSSETVIKDNLTIRTDLVSEVELLLEFIRKHINKGYFITGDLISGNYISCIRNKQIALVFKEVGLVEKYGSGIKRIIQAFTEYDLPMPHFEEFQHGFRVIVYKTPHKTPHKASLSDRILQLILEEPAITQKEVGQRLGISMDTSREYFAKLKKEGRLTRVGGRKSGYWDVSG